MSAAKRVLRKPLTPILNVLSRIQADLASIHAENNDILRRQSDLITNLQNTKKDITKLITHSGYIRISDTEIMAKIFSGAKMYLDPRDIAVVPHLILDGEWEHDITQAWLRAARDGDIVLDIGANFGYYGILAAQQTNKQCQVIMFEANPHLISYLNNTVDLNSFKKCVTVENLAVSDKKGIANLSILKDYIGSSSLHTINEINTFSNFREKAKASEVIKVPTNTVDDYCNANGIDEINLIKMDIEGYEDKAYLGMRDTVKKSKDITLFIEFTPSAYDNPKQLYELLLKDFGNIYLIGENGILHQPKDVSYGAVVENTDDWIMIVFSKKRKLI